MFDAKSLYSKLNNALKIYTDEEENVNVLYERINFLTDKHLSELNNYKIQIEENTMILQAQFEEISKLYEELTTVLEISKLIFSTKDPRLSIEQIVKRLKDTVDFKNVIVGEFVDFETQNVNFNPLYLELRDMNFENIEPILYLLKKIDSPKTILREKDSVNHTESSFLLIPIKSKLKIWGFILLYGKTDNSIFLASDKKIMESVCEQLAFGFDTINYLNEKIKQQKFDEQLKIAKEIQNSLLPKKIPNILNCQISAFYRSAYDVGGDYYDVIKINDNEVLGLLADVSGKGVPAALIMSSMRAVVRSRIEAGDSIDSLVKYVNNYLEKNIPDDRFVTAIFILLNSREKNVKIVNVGHNNCPIYLDSNEYTSVATGLPLGIFEDIDFKIEKYSYKSEFLFISYTDGITEARNEEKEEYGTKRLENLIKPIINENTNVIVNRIIDSVDNFVKSAPQHDDTTILVMKGF
ncbi:PP2C family protein-serine/threonine phosphatase [Oceanotoga teriensis]|uniref:PP2C family protein-serine/threonine phosphatase n=1 Tax=Oceanotoga teriensis TaxID=515440 RepID=UPI00271383B6|nr:PP2C family protein-serine/threonine phosphatase [Oceanotoga teriensis]MDO7975668.1 PP2C family protein-serine/threonine phosphatase [Oceanotoga teriensis]